MKKTLLIGLLISSGFVFEAKSETIISKISDATIDTANVDKVGYVNSLASNNSFSTADDYIINVSGKNEFQTDFVGFGLVDDESSNSIANLTINLNEDGEESTYADDVIGLWRSADSNSSTVTDNININLYDGVIADDVFATRDANDFVTTNNYRKTNTINLYGGTVGDVVNGGAGADENIINIYNDVVVGTDSLSGIIRVGDNETTQDISTNGTVNLIDMTESSAFLNSFKEYKDNEHGIIYGDNIKETSTLNFTNVNGTYHGGIKYFDVVNIDSDSNVKLNGTTYKADVWNIDGHMNPSGKIFSAYNNEYIELNVGEGGNIYSSFISTDDVVATNAGVLQGVKAEGSSVTIDNSGIFTGITKADSIYINNTGQINSNYYDDVYITIGSADSIKIDNSGIMMNNLELNGTAEINSTETGVLQSLNLSGDGSLILDNYGTATGSSYAIQALSDSLTGTINNYGTISSTSGNAIDAGYLDVNNLSGGTIVGSVIADNYYQDASSIWTATYSEDNGMSSIIANSITLEDGSTIDLATNNISQYFSSGDEIKVLTSTTDLSNTVGDVNVSYDSLFNTYDLVIDGTDGYLVVGDVDPTSFTSTTDSANSNHNTIVQSSHRTSEMFLEKDSTTVVNLSSGDDYSFAANTFNFMPMVGHAHQDAKDGDVGFDNKYYGGVFYLEHKFTSNFTGGLGFGYLHNNNDYEDDYGSNSNINSYRPFAFLNYDYDKFDIAMAAGYALHKVDNTRNYETGGSVYTASADYNVDEYYTHLKVGYQAYNQNNLVITPTAGLYYAYVDDESYNESGSGPLNMNVATNEYNSFKTSLGVGAKKTYVLDSGANITPEVKVKWYHELADNNSGVDSYFLDQGILFSSSGIETPRDLGDVSLKVSLNSNEQYDVYAEGFYQFGDSYYNVGGGVGVKYKF
ncbi:MAG: autotransporter domain-containing protein [Alphaproteobacteria bacterium]